MPKIVKVLASEYGKLVVETSDGLLYHADLSQLAHIKDFPKDEEAWKRVKIDSYGVALMWGSQLRLHLGQITSRAIKTEKSD